MKKLVLSLTFITLSVFTFSQSSLIVPDYSATNPSAPGNCDGSFIINSIPNGTPPYAYNWYDANGTLYYSTTTPSFSNLCEGYYYIEIFDGACNYGYVAVYLETVTGNPNAACFNNMSLTDESAPGACDGSVTVGINNFTTGLTLNIGDVMMGNTYYSSIMTSNPMTITNACLNDSLGIFIYTYDSLGYNYAEYGCFNMNNWYWFGTPFNSSCGGMYIWTETAPATDTNTCDGTASTLIWGGVPPYTYSYSTGGTNSVENNLCSGYYTVDVVDANGDTASTSFVITDSTNLYQMYFWGNPYDTLYTNALANCDLDYTQPIDSVYMDSVYYVSAYEIYVEYIIIQDTSEFLWAETYFLDTTANFLLSMSFYCENRSLYDTYTIMAWLPLADMMAMGVPSRPLQPTDISAKIYPNPVDDILNTSFVLEKQSDVLITLTDITGKSILSKSLKANAGNNMQQLNVSGLSNGIYLVNYQINGQKIQSLKMIKQ